MWQNLEQTLQEYNAKKSTTRNSFFDYVTASYFINRAYQNVEKYLDNYESTKETCDFYTNKGFLFSLKYLRENPTVPKEDKEEIKKLSELGYLLGDIDDALLKNKNMDQNKERMIQCLSLMKKGSENLLNREIERLHIHRIINSVQDKRGYLANITGISENNSEFDKLRYLQDLIEKKIN